MIAAKEDTLLSTTKQNMTHLHLVFIGGVASQLPQQQASGIKLVVPVVHNGYAAGTVDEIIVVCISFDQICCFLHVASNAFCQTTCTLAILCTLAYNHISSVMADTLMPAVCTFQVTTQTLHSHCSAQGLLQARRCATD